MFLLVTTSIVEKELAYYYNVLFIGVPNLSKDAIKIEAHCINNSVITITWNTHSNDGIARISIEYICNNTTTNEVVSLIMKFLFLMILIKVIINACIIKPPFKGVTLNSLSNLWLTVSLELK